MKKFMLTVLALAIAFGIAGCRKDDPNSDAGAKSFKGPINIISREDGSGTRGAFSELIKIVVKNDAGEAVDQTSIEATIVNTTDAVLTSVMGDKNAIGYISLASLSDDVKAIKVGGAEASAAAISDGSYPIARPFELVYREEKLSDLARDFLDFCMSIEGQKIVSDDGCIANKTDMAYKPANLSGRITIAGSTSVTPLMEKLVDAYKQLNPGFEADIQSTGSGSGIRATMEGVADIGMSSRDLKDDEKKELNYTTLGRDGIAIVVNKDNPLDNLNIDDIRKIYSGEIIAWEGIR